jgi:hypothetical protein
LIVAHGGEEVVPWHDPAAMRAYALAPSAIMGGGGGTVTLNINLTGGEGQFMRWLRGQIRAEAGGDVQRALGTRR